MYIGSNVLLTFTLKQNSAKTYQRHSSKTNQKSELAIFALFVWYGM